MSTDLYSTVLVWYGYQGIAKLHGRTITLVAAPRIESWRLAMIDYRPEIGERRIQMFDGPARDMEPREVLAADAFLGSLFT